MSPNAKTIPNKYPISTAKEIKYLDRSEASTAVTKKSTGLLHWNAT
jgi:hypothetical protein